MEAFGSQSYADMMSEQAQSYERLYDEVKDMRMRMRYRDDDWGHTRTRMFGRMLLTKMPARDLACANAAQKATEVTGKFVKYVAECEGDTSRGALLIDREENLSDWWKVFDKYRKLGCRDIPETFTTEDLEL